MIDARDRVVILVPAHLSANASEPTVVRSKLLRGCLASILISREALFARAGMSMSVEVVLIDDYSDVDIMREVRSLQDQVVVIRNAGARGQAGALNYAMQTTAADWFVITDSDCAVDADWLHEIMLSLRASSESDGVAGPNWLFSPSSGWWARYLTTCESGLMKSLFYADLYDDGRWTRRLDCRNLALRRSFVASPDGRSLFSEDGSVSVSGLASHRLKTGLVHRRIAFCRSAITRHAAVTSFGSQLRNYYRRGRTGRFAEFYRARFGSLAWSFFAQYAVRHFARPVVEKPMALPYIVFVQGAFWLGLLMREFST